MKYRIELQHGLIIGLLCSLWLLLEFALGLHTVYLDIFLYTTNLIFLIPILGLIRGLRSRKKLQQNSLNFSQGVKSGFLITIFFTAIATINQFIYHTWINPEYFSYMTQNGINKGLTQAEASAYFNLTSYLSGVCISNLTVGVITSLITSATIKTSKQVTVV